MRATHKAGAHAITDADYCVSKPQYSYYSPETLSFLGYYIIYSGPYYEDFPVISKLFSNIIMCRPECFRLYAMKMPMTEDYNIFETFLPLSAAMPDITTFNSLAEIMLVEQETS